MDALTLFPAEVWELICKYASIDGGYTARSLSLVSRTIYQASKRSRYYSLIITRWNQLFYALALIRQDPRCLGEICHLFVALSDFIPDDLILHEIEDDEDEYMPPDEDVDTEGTSSDEDMESSEEAEEDGDDHFASEDVESNHDLAEEGTRVDEQEHGETDGDGNIFDAEEDELAADITYFASEEGLQSISLVDSSQPRRYPKARLEGLKQFLTSEACQNLESLVLRLNFFDLPVLLSFLPPMSHLVRLTVIGVSRTLWNPDDSELVRVSYFPSLLDFQIWDDPPVWTQPDWVSHFPAFIRNHMPWLSRLRTPMPHFDSQPWADMLLQEDTFPRSTHLIMFEERGTGAISFHPNLMRRQDLLERIQLYEHEDAKVHTLINYWKEEIQGGYGSWPKPDERVPHRFISVRFGVFNGRNRDG
ncbi:hypothetical protein AX16_006292 [Volvariella volvacea WC 439]|nr:hypothetical protein AX16_006292 [Volvariella volvacea WC 439]